MLSFLIYPFSSTSATHTPLSRATSVIHLTPLACPYTSPVSCPLLLSYFLCSILPPASTTEYIWFMINTPAPCTAPNLHIPYSISHAGSHNTTLLQTYLSPTTRLSHDHKSTVTPPCLHRAVQKLKRKHTICLRAYITLCDTTSLYLNDQIINHTFFFQKISMNTHPIEPHAISNVQRRHRRELEHSAGATFTHEFLLIPLNITPIHWTIPVRQMNDVDAPSVISHDSLSIPLDTTAIEQHLRHYDTSVRLDPGLVPRPIRHVPVVKQDYAYN